MTEIEPLPERQNVPVPSDRLSRNVELGAAMAAAGLTHAQILAVVATIERRAKEMVMDLVPELVALAGRAHVGAALTIETRLGAQMGGRMLHSNCALIARQVAGEQPRYQ